MSVLSEARLAGSKLNASIDDRLVSLEMEGQTAGAASCKLTIRDPSFQLLRSGILKRGLELTAFNRSWKLAGLDEGADRSITATFEAKRINDLKHDFRRLVMKTTRPLFTRTLLGSKNALVIPDELRVRGKIPGALGVGLGDGDKVIVQGRAATREQRVVLDTVLAAAYEQGVGVSVLTALVAAVISESGALNVVASSDDRGGVLRLPLAVDAAVEARNMRKVAAWFTLNAGQGAPQAIAARRLSRSASRYAPFVQQASLIVRAFLRTDAVSIAGATALVKKHLSEKLALSVGTPAGSAGESRWDALQRTWTELGWYIFENATGFTVVSGQHVKVAKPDLTIHPEDPAVLEPSFSEDEGFHVNTLSFSILEAVPYAIREGMIVDVVDYGAGSGRYLLTTVRRSSDSLRVEVDLESPTAVVAAGQTAGASRDATGIDGVPDAVARAYAKAQEISGHSYPYVFGGGHGSFAAPYDCSGCVSAVLNAGGVLSAPMATGGLSTFGKAGTGKYVTVWVRETSNPHESHTFIEFTLPGKGTQHFGTGRWGTSQGGAGFKPSLHPKSGFVARHADGW